MSGYEGQVRRTLAEKGIRSLTALDIEKALLNVVWKDLPEESQEELQYNILQWVINNFPDTFGSISREIRSKNKGN